MNKKKWTRETTTHGRNNEKGKTTKMKKQRNVKINEKGKTMTNKKNKKWTMKNNEEGGTMKIQRILRKEKSIETGNTKKAGNK